MGAFNQSLDSGPALQRAVMQEKFLLHIPKEMDFYGSSPPHSLPPPSVTVFIHAANIGSVSYFKRDISYGTFKKFSTNPIAFHKGLKWDKWIIKKKLENHHAAHTL